MPAMQLKIDTMTEEEAAKIFILSSKCAWKRLLSWHPSWVVVWEQSAGQSCQNASALPHLQFSNSLPQWPPVSFYLSTLRCTLPERWELSPLIIFHKYSVHTEEQVRHYCIGSYQKPAVDATAFPHSSHKYNKKSNNTTTSAMQQPACNYHVSNNNNHNVTCHQQQKNLE